MPRDRSLVRASDIGAWAYCRRAWWLAEVKGVPHSNPAALAHGERAHRRHGHQVMQAQRLRLAGNWLLAAGAILALVAALWYLVT